MDDEPTVMVCHPDDESTIRGWIDRSPIGHRVKLIVHSECKPGEAMLYEGDAAPIAEQMLSDS